MFYIIKTLKLKAQGILSDSKGRREGKEGRQLPYLFFQINGTSMTRITLNFSFLIRLHVQQAHIALW